ncbi:hypothetical protein D3C87_2048150 [compost metagenome]
MALVHIYSPPGKYTGQIRRRGARRWEAVGNPTKTKKAAMIRAIRAMTANHKRARVLFCTDWHEPTIVMELNT